MQNYLDLSGKVALITGGSSGIGAAGASLFAELGAKVGIGYYHNEKGAEQVRESISAAGGRRFPSARTCGKLIRSEFW